MESLKQLLQLVDGYKTDILGLIAFGVAVAGVFEYVTPDQVAQLLTLLAGPAAMAIRSAMRKQEFTIDLDVTTDAEEQGEGE